MAKITLILGGTRSGKSSYAEMLALQSERPKLYLATAEALDGEMEVRIADHQKRRGAGWTTLEIPVEIAPTIRSAPPSIILVDCLTLWLSNIMHHQLNIAQQTQSLVDALQKTEADILLVSSEVGFGIVPENPLARQFRDLAGLLHQQIATVADRVVWMVAGIPTVIKG